MNTDCVEIECYLLSNDRSVETRNMWVPRHVALSESQDAFLAWAQTDEGRLFLSLHSDVYAIFVASFEFEAPPEGTLFVPRGTRVNVANPIHSLNGPGVTQEGGRIGPKAQGSIDVLLTCGNEFTFCANSVTLRE